MEKQKCFGSYEYSKKSKICINCKFFKECEVETNKNKNRYKNE